MRHLVHFRIVLLYLRFLPVLGSFYLKPVGIFFSKALKIMRPLQKGIFLPPALFANAHLLLNKLRFAA